eukprot:TRINITY_DN27680_c0_g1_i1.p1 TRINITY_DN27680_c0_g1~~TRINITY_DN27680_c0_g1_i1.p1  ORF type:complete len:466 (-),score=51.13 TRINITY_DN27680_c0_g1_i1:728-2125(-)
MEDSLLSPPAPSSQQNADHDPSRASTLELALITMALVTLMLMTLIPCSEKNGRMRRGQLQSSVGAWLFAVSVLAYLLTTTALALGWMRFISLDALVTIVFPLTASLLQVSLDTMSDFFFRTFLKSKWEFNEYLRLDVTNFWYVKVGMKCGQDPNSRSWSDNFDGRCSLGKCNARLFMFRLPEVSEHPLSNWFVRAVVQYAWRKLRAVLCRHDCHSNCSSHEQQNDSTAEVPRRQSQWDALRIGHTRHVVELQKTSFGSTFRVWNAVSSGSWLIRKPWTLYLETQDQVLEGLSLITEICAIGNLVFFLRKKYVQIELQKGKGKLTKWYNQNGLTTLIHSSFVKELNLVDWKRSNFMRSTSTDYDSPENYSSLFFLLIRKSRHLKARIKPTKYKPCARSVHRMLNELRQNRARSFREFEEELHALVDDWLASWGCERDKLNCERQETMGQLEWPKPGNKSESSFADG